MVLVCNRPDLADELLKGLKWEMPVTSKARLVLMRGRPHPLSLPHLHEQAEYVHALHNIATIGSGTAELPLA